MRKIHCLLLLGALFLASCQRDDLEYAGQSENVTGRKEALWLIKNVDNGIATRAVGEKGKYWGLEDTIRVKFLSGDAAFQEKVKEYAALWLVHTGLTFLYVGPEEQADVKIGFDTENRWVSWSTIGTDCKAVPQNEVSLNYVWWDDQPEAQIKSEILRGIGHVLGLGFEHRNPNSNVVFKATANIAGEYNLSDAEVEEFRWLYTTAQSNYTEYDKSSVMILAIPRALVMSPSQATNYNSELSDMDKQFISELYPKLIITMKYIGDGLQISVGSQQWVASSELFKSRKVDWGDGRILTLDKDYLYDHIYRDYGERTIRFYGASDTVYRLLTTNNGIASVDLSRTRELKTLYLDNGTLSALDMAQLPQLEVISLKNNRLTALDFTHSTKVRQVSCDRNQITSLDMAPCPGLTYLMCHTNPVSELNIRSNLWLQWLYCYGINVNGNDIAGQLCPRNSLEQGYMRMSSGGWENNVSIVCSALNWRVDFVAVTRSAKSGDTYHMAIPFRDRTDAPVLVTPGRE